MVYVVKHADLRHENRAIARSAVLVLKRRVWAIGRQAFNGARRFEDFQRRIGLARNILNDCLNGLVDLRILERSRYPEHAVRALDEYRLTAKDRALFPVCIGRLSWDSHRAGLAAPPVALVHKSFEHRGGVRVASSDCGQDIGGRDYRTGGRMRPDPGRVAPMTRRERRNVPPVLAVSTRSVGL
jgi:DNA-binding HxlR family transcriptional regulator